MKKFILLSFLFASFAFANAQKVTAIAFISGDRAMNLDGLTLNLPANPPEKIQFPLAIFFKNTGSVLNAGDSMSLAMIVDGETQLTLNIKLGNPLEEDSAGYITIQNLTIATSMFKETNTWCFNITAAYRSGVEIVLDEPLCATFTIGTVNVNEIAVATPKVYPNPARDFVNIENANNSTISIYNMMGQLVRKVESTSEILQINTSDFNSGIYMIKIQNGESIQTKKIQVNK